MSVSLPIYASANDPDSGYPAALQVSSIIGCPIAQTSPAPTLVQ
jgi:hypothetical protein